MDFDWKTLLQVPRWTPLNELRWPVRQIDEGLFELGDHVFIAAQDIDKDYRPSICGPRLMSIVWAEGRGAALRLLADKVESDNPQARLRPPAELAPDVFTNGCTYAEITEALREGRFHFAELDVFRMRDEVFVYRRLQVGRMDIAFRSRDPEDGETPFAVKIVPA